jgi:hypothetical protein
MTTSRSNLWTAGLRARIELDEQRVVGARPDGRRLGYTDGLPARSVEPVEARSHPEKRLTGSARAQHLLGDVGEERSLWLTEPLDCRRPVSHIDLDQPFRGEPNRCRPAVREHLEAGCQHPGVIAQVREEGGRLVLVEGEAIGAKLDHLPLAAKALDQEWDGRTADHHDVKRWRCAADEAR